MYAKRHNDARLSYVLSVVPRRQRHNFPVYVADDNNQYLQKMQKQRDNFNYYMLGLAGVFMFCGQRYTKAYYPYGIIVRRAVPTTPMAQASYYGPMLAFFGYSWWMMKEYPRTQRIDLTSDDE